METLSQALEFYKWIFVYLCNQISFKKLLLEIIITIVILAIIHNFPVEADSFFVWIRERTLNILLITPFILLLIKSIKTIYQYKFKIFSTEEEKLSIKQNNIFHLKRMFYAALRIWFGLSIITFIFASIWIITWDITPTLNQPRESFVAIVLLSIVVIKWNFIVSLHLFDKERRIYRLNYFLLPMIVVIWSYIYLSVNS